MYRLNKHFLETENSMSDPTVPSSSSFSFYDLHGALLRHVHVRAFSSSSILNILV